MHRVHMSKCIYVMDGADAFGHMMMHMWWIPMNTVHTPTLSPASSWTESNLPTPSRAEASAPPNFIAWRCSSLLHSRPPLPAPYQIRHQSSAHLPSNIFGCSLPLLHFTSPHSPPSSPSPNKSIFFAVAAAAAANISASRRPPAAAAIVD